MRARFRETRIGAAALALWGIVVGAAPHVLHHVGPLAGAALLAGASGKLLFGAVGLAFSIPFLRRLHRRFRTLLAPVVAAGTFVALFALSTLVVSPLLTNGGDDNAPIEQPGGHAAHHRK